MRPKLRPYVVAPVALASLAALVAFSVASSTAQESHRALKSHVKCGDTITADTTLDGDLLECPNNGIVIGGDDITVDLNGHTVAGDGKEFEQCAENEFCDMGVLNDGH